MRPIRIALTKGRLENSTVALFEKIGYNCEQLKNKGRKLILEIPEANLEVVLGESRRCHHLCGTRRLRHGRCGKRHHYGIRRQLF